MIRAQPMLVLDDVEAGSRWFCEVLGFTSGHGGSEYEMLMDGDELVAQLHRWDAHEHPHLGNPGRYLPRKRRPALVLVDDFDAVVDRANASGAEVLEGPTFNTGAQQHEIWMRGPEGYAVVVASVRVSPG